MRLCWLINHSLRASRVPLWRRHSGRAEGGCAERSVMSGLTSNYEQVLAESFVEQVAACMATCKVSKSELARRTGMSRPQLSNLFNHPRNMRLATMARIALALGADLEVGLTQ